MRQVRMTRREILNPWLNRLSPDGKARCEEEIEKSRINGEKALIIDAPQLFEAKMEDVCDFTVAVTADTAVRIKRLSERDMLSDADIEKRIKNLLIL